MQSKSIVIQDIRPAKPQRIEIIDLLRGIIMIIMALDHTRDNFHYDAWVHDPLDPATTTPLLYFTRWITHFCASNFVFLSGVSIWLQSRRKTSKELSRFLITRGLWLIFLEITFVNTGVQADFAGELVALQVIWAIGISMVILGILLLTGLRYAALLFIGLLIILGHNSLDYPEAAKNGNVSFFWHLLHFPGYIPFGKGHTLIILYPFLPWTGLMIIGYCAGKLFTDFQERARNKILLRTGVGLLILFIVLRLINSYGDPLHWSSQKTPIQVFFSFMNVQKYPPSLLYICVTVGPALLFMSLFKTTTNKLTEVFIVFGRVPFFYYLLHFYLLTILRVIIFFVRGHSLSEGLIYSPGAEFKFLITGEGFDLGGVYLIWVLLVIFLYPLCRWYDRYKTNHKEKWWLSYL